MSRRWTKEEERNVSKKKTKNKKKKNERKNCKERRTLFEEGILG